MSELEKRLLLVLGGARSGKSSYAEATAARIASEHGRVLYVATAQPIDDEMARRIARHRLDRPATWPTLEEPIDPGPAIATAPGGPFAVVLLDCVTIWLSNLLIGPDHDPEVLPGEEQAGAIAGAAVDRLLAAHRDGSATTILVSNEVGMGLVPPYPLGRIYRDLLGRVNARLADEADEVYLLIAGLPLRIKPNSGLS